MAVLVSLTIAAQEMPSQSSGSAEEAPSIKLYPNPAFDDVVYITTESNATKQVVVYDVFGAVVLRDHITNSALNISKLVPGVYVLQVTENNTVMTRKLVVK